MKKLVMLCSLVSSLVSYPAFADNSSTPMGATSFPVTTTLGGTGSSGGFSLYSPIYAGTTSTGAFQSGTVGVAGNVLTSNGAGALPTFKAATGGSGTPGGNDTEVQYNSSSTFAGASNLTIVGGVPTATTIDVNGGTIDGTKIGSASAADATFSTIIGTRLEATKIGGVSAADATFSTIIATRLEGTKIGSVSSADATFNAIVGTKLDGAKIGSVSAADATFSTIRATKIDATKIGTSSAADATFSTATATKFVGPLTGNADTVTTNANLTGEVTSSGNAATIADGVTVATWTLTGSTIDSSKIGSSSAADATFATIRATKMDATRIGVSSATDATFTALKATGGGSLTGTWSDMGTATTIDINGGTVDGTRIGASSAADATFSTLIATRLEATKIGAVSAQDATFATIRATKLDATKIGTSSSADATFTTVTIGSTLLSLPVTTSNGGTGSAAGFALYSPIFAGTTSTGVFQSGTLGIAGNALVSNGAGVLPTFQAVTGGSGAPTDADYLVGTTNGSLSAEIVVGTSPGGELGNTWASPTIDDGVAVASWALTSSTIDSSKIGSSSAADATFSTVIATKMDGTKIGTSSAADATFNTLDVNFSISTLNSGTGSLGGFALYSPIFAGTTSTGAFQSGTVGSSGHVLTSNGTGALPTFKPLGAASLGVGGAITSGTGSRVLYEDSGNLLAEDANLQFDGTTLLADTVDINGGAIDGTKIGASSYADATFAAISSSGPATTDVTGKLRMWDSINSQYLDLTTSDGTMDFSGGLSLGAEFLGQTLVGNNTAHADRFVLQLAAHPTQSVNTVIIQSGTGSSYMRVNKDGYLGIYKNVVPADGDLSTSEGMIYWDNTVGATGFGYKGKDTAASVSTDKFASLTKTETLTNKTINASKIGASSAGDATFTNVALTTGTFGVNTTVSSTGTITANGLNLQQVPVTFNLSTTIAPTTTTVGQNCAGDDGWSVPAIYNNFKVTTVSARVTSVNTSAIWTANIRNRTTANNVLSTGLTIDANELTTTTAATPAVINQANNTLSTDDDICVQVSITGTGHKGARVDMVLQK